MARATQEVELRDVIRLDLDRVVVDPLQEYDMVGVCSFGRGLFRREPVLGSATSYKYFYRLQANHIVMSQLFGWEGALALSNEEFAGRFVSPQFPTFSCHEGQLDRDFFGWYMRRPAFWESLAKTAKGIGDRRRTLNPDSLLSIKIALPPLAEQQRIAARVEEMAAKIEEARRLRRDVVEGIEALARSLFNDKSNGAPTLTSMSDLVSLRLADVAVEQTETYHFAGVYSFGRGVFAGQRKAGSEFSYKRLTRLRAGDFVYPKLMAWEGALGVVPPECDGLVVSPEFPVFDVYEDKVLPEVLDVYFRIPSVWQSLAGTSTGTNVRRRRLHPKEFLAHEIPLPPMETQLKLRQVLDRTDAIGTLQTATEPELNALMPAILDRAFQGRL